MLSDEIKAFKENVNSLTWLDDATRIGVFEKVDCMGKNVGFPDYFMNSRKIRTLFRNYKGLTIGYETYFKNKVSILKKDWQQTLKDFRKPKDSTLWSSNPLEANAGYNQFKNEITIPAAFLQPPFFHPNKFLRAYNFGNLGAVFGHEVMHGFGSQGRSYDVNGKESNWWSNNALLEFDKRLKCYEKQYSAYKILGKWPINAKNTAEENVVDSGALKIALKAYYNWATENPNETWQLPGLNFTNEQLFYVGIAQGYCSSYTPEEREESNAVSSHADDKFRVIIGKFLRVRQNIQVQNKQPNESSQQMLSLE